ncbi:MAG: right-handed parallel beta-helix repeat-containing protein [Candidatus Brocadiae bacterium]|nr:right-handed parallel beta-helix repeat-containing protein [Candidatus Brocadiia bacterium]
MKTHTMQRWARVAGALLLGAALMSGTAAGAMFHVKDYGAVPGTEENSAPGIEAAIAAAIEAGPGAEVVLDAGTYRVEGDEGESAAITIGEAKGITVRGQGTKTLLVVTNPRQGCFFLGVCEGVTVADMAVDWDPLPFTQGHIVAVDVEGGTFDFELQEGYPDLSMPMFEQAPEPFGKWGMVFDRKKRLLKAGAPDHTFMESWEHVEGRVWRMHPTAGNRRNVRFMEPGDRFVYMARGGPGGAAFFFHSKQCGVRNFTVYSAPGLVTGSVASDAIHFDGLQVRHKPGTDRLLTSDADGIHVQQNITGPTIENCFFEGMADDSINIYYPPNVVKEVVSPTELVLVRGGIIQPGDRLRVVESGAGIIRGEATAETVERQRGGLMVTLSMPVEGIIAGPDNKTADTIHNLSRCGAGFQIRNNVFRNHRRHAVYIKATDGVVEDNVIERVAGLGIVIADCADWPEGVVPSNVVVRNNVIRDVGYALGYGQGHMGAAIQANATARGFKLAGQRTLRNIAIEGNTIINPPGAGIYVGAADGVSISGNRIEYRKGCTPARETGAVILENAQGVSIDGLHVQSPHAETTAAIEVRESVEVGDAGVTVGEITARLLPGVALLDDRR